MFISTLRRILSWLSKAVRDPKILTLLGILALAAYLRLWNINHLFNGVHDYDEGCLSLGARFITQGYLPYRDFVLVHPPFYSLVLAGFYKIFGYGFFPARYLSVAISLVCVVIIYLLGKRLSHPSGGLVAAALFAVCPDMVYSGRRPVQEMLGIFLMLLAIYFALDFIQNGKQNRAFLCGLLMGLAVATKYTLFPGVLAIMAAVVLMTMGERFWKSLKTLGRPALWVMYVCFAAMFYSLLLILNWSFKLDVPVPFIDPMYRSVDTVVVAILVFFLPLVLALFILERNLPFKRWWLRFWELRHNRGLWLLLGGTVLGFFGVTGFFLAKMPQEFIYQTILVHLNRTYLEVPSLVGIIRTVFTSVGFLKMAFLSILLAIPVLFALLNKKDFSKSVCFISAALIVSLVACQALFHVSRYYITIFPLMFLAIGQFAPPPGTITLTTQLKGLAPRLKASLLVISAIFLFFTSGSVVLLTNYTGYDINQPWFSSAQEEQVYRETADYLEGAGAKKVYAVNPIIPALAPNLNSSLNFETFAMLFLEEKPPEEIIKDLKAEGVDYVVLDAFIRYWGPPFSITALEFVQEVRHNARLMAVIEPDSRISTEIYLLGAEPEGIFNGDFSQWLKTDETSQPLGWQPVLLTGQGDEAVIKDMSIEGVKCLGMAIYEDGMRDETRDTTHAGVFQKILFPTSKLKVKVFPTVNTETTGRVVLGSGIHFVDEDGRSVIIGFSDKVEGEQTIQYGDYTRFLVIKQAPLNQWSEQTIDLAAYWAKARWWQPKEVNLYLLASTSYTEPGYYAFYVAQIETEDAK
jgi:4-amino-4-deoxy-L-arabinose transferase-like glycosyltransferase